MFSLNFRIRIIVQLHFQECTNAVADRYHPFDTVLCCLGDIYRRHPAVLTIVDLSVKYREREIPDVGISGDRVIFLNIPVKLIIDDLSVDIGNSFIKKLFEIGTLIRDTIRRHSKTSRHEFHLAENHFRMLNEIAVHRNTVFIGTEMNPRRLYVDNTVSLLQDQNIRHGVCSRVSSEGIVG